MARLAETAVSGGERSDGVEHCLAGIARLSNEVKDSSSRIPAYDLRTYNDVGSFARDSSSRQYLAHAYQAIKALFEKLQKTRASFAPRPKFSFKSAIHTRSSFSSPKREGRGRPETRMGDSSGPKSAPAMMQDTLFDVDDETGEHKKYGHGMFGVNNPVTKQFLNPREKHVSTILPTIIPFRYPITKDRTSLYPSNLPCTPR